MSALAVIVGVATVYAGSYVDGPLYCARPGHQMRYDLDALPWVAVDVREYESGRIWCGDELWLRFEDGTELQALALDAGPFEGYYVEEWGADRAIVVDVPAHLAPFPGLSAPVTMVNHSAVVRELEQRVER